MTPQGRRDRGDGATGATAPRRTPRRRRTAAMLGAGVLAAAAGRLLSPGAPPLFDGVGNAPPYRYVCLPPNVPQQVNVRPQPATETDPLQGGKSPPISFVDMPDATVPQVQLLIAPDGLTLPAGAPSVTVTATPIPPPGILPSDGAIDGNVYAISVTAAGRPLTVKAGPNATLVLRGPPTGKQAVVEEFDGRRWSTLPTQPVGTADIFGANGIVAFGDFALVLPGPPATPGPCDMSGVGGGGGSTSSPPGAAPDGGGSSTGIVVVGAAVGGLLLAGGLVLALRRTDDPPGGSRGGGRTPGGGGTGPRRAGGGERRATARPADRRARGSARPRGPDRP